MRASGRTGVVVTAAVLIAGNGIAAADPANSTCATVAAPMVDVPRQGDGEPTVRLPVPDGWEEPPGPAAGDSSLRLAIVNPALAAEGFTPNAVVALKAIGADIAEPQQILAAQNELLVAKAVATELVSETDQVCGLPAMITSYTAPATESVPPRSAATRVVVYESGAATYIATVTVQAVDTGNGSYAQDAETILDGLQVLAAR
jgi:hypothetical protein